MTLREGTPTLLISGVSRGSAIHIHREEVLAHLLAGVQTSVDNVDVLSTGQPDQSFGDLDDLHLPAHLQDLASPSVPIEPTADNLNPSGVAMAKVVTKY